MPDALRLVTSPLPVAAGLGYTHLSAAVAADALARRRWAAGRAASVVLPALSGDLGGRLAFDRHLVRLGHDRTTLSVLELDDAAKEFDASRRAAAAARLDALGVAADLDEGTASAASRSAATVAFVRLYEEGLIHVAQTVVPHCPSCATVIEGPDAVAGVLDGESLELALTGGGHSVDVVTSAPELIEGTVAVAVPVGHPARRATVTVPLVDRPVPVVEEPGCVRPRLLVPAHDGGAFATAQLHGFVPIHVLTPEGVVRGDGPLGGLSRFAARQAARALLEAEGVVTGVLEEDEPVDRCRQCGSIAISVLGWHWLLRIGDLEVAAADAIRHDSVAFVPAEVRDTVLMVAGGPAWCIDRSVPGGVPLPVTTCRDCDRMTVAVDTSSSCTKCFGDIEPVAATLDARFVGALSPLARAGWPGRISGDQVTAARSTAAVVASDAIESWALPALALGLHLAGYVPFSKVVVQPLAPVAGAEPPGDDVDPRVARLVLLAGVDVDAATAAVADLDVADAGDDDGVVVAAVEAATTILDEDGPGHAARLLVAALTGGVPASSADRVRALAVPFLGA